MHEKFYDRFLIGILGYVEKRPVFWYLKSERMRIRGSLNLPDTTFQQLGMQSLVFRLVHRILVDFFRT
ncbi:unnamed protein product [Rhizophagus irregularis]|nr:unnamed protein product [Rhizophagus irregularis]